MKTKNLLTLIALLITCYLKGQFNYNWAKADTVHHAYMYDNAYVHTDAAGNVYWIYSRSSTSYYAATIAKYSPNGSLLFEIPLGRANSPSSCYVTGMTVDNSGNIYIAGIYKGAVYFDPTDSSNVTTGSFINFLTKYDTNGNFVFRNRPNSASNINGLAVDNNENIYMVGSFTGTAIFYSTITANTYITANGNSDAFVAKYDTAGNALWAKYIGGSNYDYAYSLVVDNSGNAYVAGDFWGSANFNSGGSAYQTSTGLHDAYVAMYTTTGAYQWARCFGASTDDHANYIAFDNSGSLVVCAYASSGQFILKKYSTAGGLYWTDAFTGTGKSQANGLAFDSNNNILVTGYFTKATDFDVSNIAANLSSTADKEDMFVAKYNSLGGNLWAKKLGDSLVDIGKSAAIFNDNLYITGRFSDTLDFDLSTASAVQVSASDTGNHFLASYNVTASAQANILTFSFPQQISTAIIDTVTQTVDITVAPGTNLTSLVPTFTVSAWATSSPLSGVAQNFSSPFMYVVTAQNGTTYKNWIVHVHIASSQANMLTFSFPQQVSPAVIDTTAQTVAITIAYGTNLNGLLPTYTVSPFATSSPASGIAQDFSAPFTYLVTAQDGITQKSWVVNVLVAPNTQANILTFSLPQQFGGTVIDTLAQTVDVMVQAGSNLSNLVPAFTVSAGATSTPVSGVAQNFTVPFTYVVSAEDGVTQKNWVVHVSLTSGLAETTAQAIKIYPNPASNTLIIELPANSGKQMFTLLDVTGKILLSQLLVDAKTTLSLPSISSGLYYYKVGTKAGKLIID